MGEHTLGCAPEQHLSNRTVSVGAHDEKIGASMGHELADQFRSPGADYHLFSRRHAVVKQIGLSRREDFLSGLTGARHIRERAPHPMRVSKHGRHDKGAGGVNASIVRNQYVMHVPKFLSRHQYRPDRTADYGRDQRIQIVALAYLSVTFPSHDHYVVGDGLTGDYFTGNAGLTVGAARNALRRTFRSKSM